jgi:hypothetical protein
MDGGNAPGRDDGANTTPKPAAEAARKPIGGNDLLIASHELKRIRGLNVENRLA